MKPAGPAAFALPGAIALLAVFPSPAAAQMPEDYVRTARALAAPLYPVDQTRPAPDLQHCTTRDGAALGATLDLAPAAGQLRSALGGVRSELGEAAFCLLSIASIDGVQPKNRVLLERGLDALVGDKQAEERFADTLGGVVVAELSKAGLRAAYRNSLDRRRAAALAIWQVAQEHAGPPLKLSPLYGIGVRLDSDLAVAEVLPGHDPGLPMPTGSAAREHVVKAGESLAQIATEHYGDAAMAARILQANRDRLGDGGTLRAGVRLRIPSPGIRVGDRVLAVDGVATGDVADAGRRLRGPRGSSVRVRLRDPHGQERDIVATRSVEVSDSSFWIDLNASWGGAFDRDDLWMSNLTGVDLSNVTLYVKLYSGDREVHHIHFTPTWADGESKHAVYLRQCDYSPDESADHVDAVHVWVYSDQARFDRRYDYAGAQLQSDIDRWFPTLSFTGGLREAQEGFFTDKPAGFHASFTGLPQIAPETVVVRMVDGNVARTVNWTMDGPWKSGGWPNAREFRHEAYGGLSPDRVEMTFHFPGATTPPTLTWKYD